MNYNKKINDEDDLFLFNNFETGSLKSRIRVLKKENDLLWSKLTHEEPEEIFDDNLYEEM